MDIDEEITNNTRVCKKCGNILNNKIKLKKEGYKEICSKCGEIIFDSIK